jgi:3D (Asp-Asp-Asp) domain-containing protein
MIFDAPHPVVRAAVATSYSPCSSGSTMANGKRTHLGAAASVGLPLGTRIRLVGPSFYGHRLFTIEDTGALAPNQLDLWTGDCGRAVRWGRRQVRYIIIRTRGTT